MAALSHVSEPVHACGSVCECHWKEILADGGPLMRLYCTENCKQSNHRTNVTFTFISLVRKAISVECRIMLTHTHTYKYQYTTPIQAVGTHFLEYTRTLTLLYIERWHVFFSLCFYHYTFIVHVHEHNRLNRHTNGENIRLTIRYGCPNVAVVESKNW